MNKITYFTLFLLVFTLACGKENVHKCCAASPIFEAIGNGLLFIPNIFTPNADGTNDVFKPDGSSISKLSLTIKSGALVAFETTQGFTDFWKADGVAAAKYTFTYSATSNDGTIKTGSGEVCVVRDEQITNCTSCAFSSQFDGISFDSNTPSGESICD
jgi:CHU_C Type IX secretion signal domain